jgi:predicted component of type VI protein secretion system
MAKKSSGIVAASASIDWAVQRDLETMLECEKIEADPKRLAKVQALAKKTLLDLAGIASEGKDD